MMRKFFLILVIYISVEKSSAQSTLTSFIVGFAMLGGQPFYSSPRSIIQMPDSSFRLFASYKQNIQSNYSNGIVHIAKNGAMTNGSVLNTNTCYWGHGFGQLKGVNRNYFLYSQPAEYCSEYQTISKVTTDGNPLWQIAYTDVLSYPEPLRGDSFCVSKGNYFVIYNSNGDSLMSISGKSYTNITQIQSGNYLARDSKHWVLLNKSLQEVWRKNDSLTGIKGTVVSYQKLSNGKYAVLSKEKCVYDPVLLGWWCNYVVTTLTPLFQFESSDSVSNSINSEGSALVTELADGGLLLVTPQGRYDLNITKMINGITQYSHTINTASTNKSFGIYGSEFHAFEIVSTLDKGKLLVIEKENGPYDRTTMLMKFDSVGNFYWPFTTGWKDLSNISHSVYPNPVADKLHFELNEPGKHTLMVTDASGQVIYQNTVKDKVEIETAQWSNGVYFYHLSSGSKTTTGKFVKM